MFSKTYTRWLAGAALTLGLALSGTLLATNPVSAQTPPSSATAIVTPAPATTPGAATNPAAPGDRGGGPGGMGIGGKGGHGPGGAGAAATADGATNAITRTNTFLTLVKSDLTYATGKMDTASAQSWITAADKLMTQATTAQTAQQYGQASAYAEAAQAVARTAELAMQQALGADKLPSYGQQSAGNGMHGPLDGTQATTAPTQAQVSRDLQRTYTSIVSQGAVIGSNADAQSYLTQAQAAYKAAYDSYQAGNYTAAHQSSALAQSLLRVVDSLQHVAAAGTSADAPVTVPAPNF
jgi:hypothetical protein